MKKLKFLLSKWKTFFTSKKDTAYMLDYLTLRIKEQQVKNDFLAHLVQQRALVHWISVIVATLNMLFEAYNHSTGGDLYTLVKMLIYFFAFAMANTVFYYKYKNGLLWTPSICLVFQAILAVYVASPIGESMATKTPKNSILNSMM